MKTIISLLSIIITFSQDIKCNESILSKFHQHTYKLKDVRIQLISYDKNYFNFFEMIAFKYNRTTTAHNGTLNIKVDFDNKLEVITQVYKFLSNEYRRTSIRFQINVQKAFESNAIGLHAMAKCGNITSLRFFKNITYHTCFFVIDESKFPPLVPNGRYRLELTLLLLNKEIAVLYFYCEVYTPIVYPKA